MDAGVTGEEEGTMSFESIYQKQFRSAQTLCDALEAENERLKDELAEAKHEAHNLGKLYNETLAGLRRTREMLDEMRREAAKGEGK